MAEYARLADDAFLRSHGLFVAEGRLVVERLVARGRFAVRSLLLNEAALLALGPALEALPPAVPVYVAPTAHFEGITGFHIHRGCLALAERPPAADPATLLRAAHTAVVLEAVANADNLGGVFRNAAAFGADAVLLSPACCDPLYRKAIRTSMAAALQVPFARLEPWAEGLATVRAEGFAIIALTPNRAAETLDRFAARAERTARFALLLGAEGAGLTSQAEAMADYRVRIPIRPDVDSLNLAVAAGIALSRLSERRNL